jgi:hypothetical protein
MSYSAWQIGPIYPIHWFSVNVFLHSIFFGGGGPHLLDCRADCSASTNPVKMDGRAAVDKYPCGPCDEAPLS